MQRPIIFLHIPKTAGQSVHDYMTRGMRKDEVCPARENRQLVGLSIPTLRSFKLFSGHLDWAHLDCVGGTPFTFTILRDPMDRIVSFYFFLRRKAACCTPEELNLPQNQGMKAALGLTPDEYFCGGPPHLRTFLDDHYDNFYTFYFAGRSFDSRRRILGELGRVPPSLTMDDVIGCARQNLQMLDGVYRLSELSRLEADLKDIGIVAAGRSLAETRNNVGDGDTESRLDDLRKLGPSDLALAALDRMTRFDQQLWLDDSLFRSRSAS